MKSHFLDQLADIQFCDNDWRQARHEREETEKIVICLSECLEIATAALEQYASGKTWRHIATDALEEIDSLIQGKARRRV